MHIKIKIFGNKILAVNPQALKVEKEFLVYSQYAKIGTKPVPITPKNCETIEATTNKDIRTEEYITGIYFDHSKQLYYIFCLHKTPENKDDLLVRQRAFSIYIK